MSSCCFNNLCSFFTRIALNILIIGKTANIPFYHSFKMNKSGGNPVSW